MSEVSVAAPREAEQPPGAEWVGFLADALAEERDRRKRIEARAVQAINISAGGLALVAVMQGLDPNTGSGFNNAVADGLAVVASLSFIGAMVLGIWATTLKPTPHQVSAVSELRRVNKLLENGAKADAARTVTLGYIDQLEYLRRANDAHIHSRTLKAMPALMVFAFVAVAVAYLLG